MTPKELVEYVDAVNWANEQSSNDKKPKLTSQEMDNLKNLLRKHRKKVDNGIN